jgi:hypothetical protein
VAIALGTRRVQTRLARKRTGPAEWLVSTRRPLADASALEPQASRDATEQDAGSRYRDDLAPTRVSEAEWGEPARGELARGITAGLCMEASFQRGKGEGGMAQYQGRTWEGWHHHMALTLIAVWFLMRATHRGQQFTPALTLPHVRDGVSILLLGGFCTRSIASVCRQVQRQVMRNELARFYHHRTRNCIPPMKLRRDIQ